MNRSLVSTLALAALAGASSLAATADSATAGAKDQAIVELSPFEVSGSASVGRYASLESVSGGRVRIDIMDSSQSVSVITDELLADVSPGRVLDAARYVAGVSDSTLPISWERTTVRGFQAEGRTMDGITYGTYPNAGFQNLDPAIIDRIEVVKGPNSILAPQPTSPGGTINLATKKPQFRDFGTVGLRLGRFDANSAFIDVNRKVNDRLAVRFVGSGRDWDNWWKGSYMRSTTLMPAFTYRFSAKTQVTLQYTYTDWQAQNYFGLPLDPTSTSTNTARLLPGVPRDLDVFADDVYRATRQHEFKLLFVAELWKGIQMRLLAAYNKNSMHAPQTFTGVSRGGPGGNIDPLTGYWNYGVSYAQTPPYAASPLGTLPTRVFIRTGTELYADPRQANVQNDYAYLLENASLKSTTLAGFAYSYVRNDNSTGYSLVTPELDIDRYIDTAWRRDRVTSSNHTRNRFNQAYVSESVGLLRKQLILNATESWQRTRASTFSLITNRYTSSSSLNTSRYSYGVVLKPWQDTVSLYHSSTSVTAGSTSRQQEFGVRLKAWDSKLFFTVAHYAIAQDNFQISNPARTTDPSAPSILFSDRKARGWEYELRANPFKNLSLLGSYTCFRSRDPNNVEFQGVAEKVGGLLASYKFDREHGSMLDGLRVAVGVDYLGKRPGDVAMGITAASTPARVIPNQPTFYLGSRTLVNLTFAYSATPHWALQVNVDNALDREYLLASNNRTQVFPGTPRNLRASVQYKF